MTAKNSSSTAAKPELKQMKAKVSKSVHERIAKKAKQEGLSLLAYVSKVLTQTHKK